MNDFEPEEKAPNDIYEFEKATKSPSRFQAALVATAGFVIFGGLVGGGAFAMNGGLPGLLPGAPSAPAAATTDAPSSDSGNGADPALTDGPAVANAETPNTASESASTASSDQALPTAASSDSTGVPDPASTSTDSTSPSASTAPSDSTAPSTAPSNNQIVVPPVFNRGGDDNNENDGGESKHHKHKAPSASPSASASASGVPTFGSGDDEGDGGD